jgi:hypothetical protein
MLYSCILAVYQLLYSCNTPFKRELQWIIWLIQLFSKDRLPKNQLGYDGFVRGFIVRPLLNPVVFDSALNNIPVIFDYLLIRRISDAHTSVSEFHGNTIEVSEVCERGERGAGGPAAYARVRGVNGVISIHEGERPLQAS